MSDTCHACHACHAKDAEIQKLTLKLESMREALRAFGKHTAWCWSRTDKGCSCGLTQLKSEGVSP